MEIRLETTAQELSMTKALTGRGEVEARVGQMLPDYVRRLEPLSSSRVFG